MNPSTPHVEDSLLEFVYGELGEKDARAVEAHVETCPQCKAQLDDIQGVRRVMSKLPEPSAPAAGLESLLAYAEQAARRAQSGPAPKPAWWRKWVLPLAGVSAAVAFGIVAQRAYEGRDLAQAVQSAASKHAEAELAPPSEVKEKLRAQEGVAEAPAALQPVVHDKVEAANQRPTAVNPFGDARDVDLEKDARVERQKRKAVAPPSASKNEEDPSTRGSPLIARGLLGGTSGAGVSGGGAAAQSGLGAVGGLGASRAGPVAPAQKPAAEKKQAPRRKEVEDARSGEAALDEASVAEFSKSAAPPPSRERSAPEAAAPTASAPTAPAPMAPRAAVAPPAAARTPASAASEEAAPTTESEARVNTSAKSSTTEDARVRQLLDSARAAQAQRRYDDAAALLRTALRLKVSDSRLRMEALSLSCDVQYAMGNTSSAEAFCQQLVSEFPNSGAAQVANRRMARERAGTPAANQAAPASDKPARTSKPGGE